MLIYEKSEYIRVVYRPELNYIIFDWLSFFVSLEEIKELHYKALSIAQKEQCFYYVAETSKVTTILRPEVIEWWGEEWVPRMEKAGIQAIITVVPKSVIATLSTQSWQAKVVNNITMKNVKTLEEAEALIQVLRPDN